MSNLSKNIHIGIATCMQKFLEMYLPNVHVGEVGEEVISNEEAH